MTLPLFQNAEVERLRVELAALKAENARLRETLADLLCVRP